MLCRICFRDQAVIHVLDRPSDDPLAESHYCLACYEHRYVHPPTGWIAVLDDPPRPIDPPPFPLSRFPIRGLMIVAGLFAFLNAAVALIMRSPGIRGTPAQVRDWTTKAFLIANPYFAILAVEVVSILWLRKLYLQKIAGGVPFSRLKAIDPNIEWTIAWEGASPLERILYALCRSWPFLPLVQIVFMVRSRGGWVFDLALFPLLLGFWIVLFLGLVVCTRPR
jgi:hypothetical protein